MFGYWPFTIGRHALFLADKMICHGLYTTMLISWWAYRTKCIALSLACPKWFPCRYFGFSNVIEYLIYGCSQLYLFYVLPIVDRILCFGKSGGDFFIYVLKPVVVFPMLFSSPRHPNFCVCLVLFLEIHIYRLHLFARMRVYVCVYIYIHTLLTLHPMDPAAFIPVNVHSIC